MKPQVAMFGIIFAALFWGAVLFGLVSCMTRDIRGEAIDLFRNQYIMVTPAELEAVNILSGEKNPQSKITP